MSKAAAPSTVIIGGWFIAEILLARAAFAAVGVIIVIVTVGDWWIGPVVLREGIGQPLAALVGLV